jgi:hypothetical protein
MRRVQVFDVNETLLDLSGLDPLFERAFGDASRDEASCRGSDSEGSCWS